MGVSNRGRVVKAGGLLFWTQAKGWVNIIVPGSGYINAWNISGDGKTVAGWGYPGGSMTAFVWSMQQGLRYLPKFGMPGEPDSAPFGISRDGKVVVGDEEGYVDKELYGDIVQLKVAAAFRWTESDGITNLGLLPGRNNSRAIRVSPDGKFIVGYSWFLNYDTGTYEGGPPLSAFLWSAKSGMLELDSPVGQSEAGDVALNGKVVVGDTYLGEDSSGKSLFDALVWTSPERVATVAHFCKGLWIS